MTEQDRKLAEEALKKYFEPCGIGCTTERQDLQLAITLNPSIDRIIKAMQAYHEAKMRKENIVESFERENQYVTDEDIQEYALQIKRKESLCTVNYYATGFIEGAKAMRDGKIKPVSRDNDC